MPFVYEYKIVSVTCDVLATVIIAIIPLQSPYHSASSLHQTTVMQPHPVSWTGLRSSGPILWNSLPPELRCPKDSGSPGTNILSKSTFLSKLKTSFASLILAPPNLHLPLSINKIQPILLAKIIKLTSNDLDSIGYLLQCMTLRFLYVRASNTRKARKLWD